MPDLRRQPTCTATVGKLTPAMQLPKEHYTPAVYNLIQFSKRLIHRRIHLLQPGFVHGNTEVEKEELFRISGHLTAWPEQPLPES